MKQPRNRTPTIILLALMVPSFRFTVVWSRLIASQAGQQRLDPLAERALQQEEGMRPVDGRHTASGSSVACGGGAPPQAVHSGRPPLAAICAAPLSNAPAQHPVRRCTDLSARAARWAGSNRCWLGCSIHCCTRRVRCSPSPLRGPRAWRACPNELAVFRAAVVNSQCLIVRRSCPHQRPKNAPDAWAQPPKNSGPASDLGHCPWMWLPVEILDSDCPA